MLSESDKAMSVVKDLFGDDPKVNFKNLKNFPILVLMDFSGCIEHLYVCLNGIFFLTEVHGISKYHCCPK